MRSHKHDSTLSLLLLLCVLDVSYFRRHKKQTVILEATDLLHLATSATEHIGTLCRCHSYILTEMKVVDIFH